MDNHWSEEFSQMHPSTGIMDLNKPFTVSRNSTLPPPLVATIVNWIIEGDEVST